LRLFVCIDPGSDNRLKLEKYITLQRKHGALGSFTRAGNLHLTLAFIGETDRAQAAAAALDALDFAPFTLFSGEIGTFSGGGKDVVWLGVKKCPELEKLAADTAQALRRSGFAIEKRPFVPHLTLGRGVRNWNASLPPPEFSALANEVVLMESTRVNGVIKYIPLHILMARD